MTYDEQIKEFIAGYSELCKDYGMRIVADQGPSSMGDIELSVDGCFTPTDVDIHIRALIDNS
tara:strand:+ start:1071 stop:1256 length:186 start_codon:yes stop_codon:yes gene_type:complete